MGEVDPALEVALGTPVPFRWSVARAVLCVYALPFGGLHRAVWQLESSTGAKFGCVLAEGRDGTIHYRPDGQQLGNALEVLPGFDARRRTEAQEAIATATAGRFVCWQRTEPPAEPGAAPDTAV